MERIKQALDRARQERQVQKEPTAGPVQAATLTTPAGSHEPVTEAPITYSRTRVETVSPAVLKKRRVITGIDNDPATIAYKMLRTQVLQRMVAKGWNALAVTSPGPGQGKTLTAINLSISLAREVHHTVLLVDLDMRNPGVHRYFGLQVSKGIGDFMMRGTPLQEVLINPGIERLVILPGRERLENSSELLSSPKMAMLVDELKSRYPSRLIIFDLPPTLSVDDALAFAPYVDAALMVIEEGRTTKEELQHAVGLLGRTQILGTVLNKSAEKIAPYY